MTPPILHVQGGRRKWQFHNEGYRAGRGVDIADGEGLPGRADGVVRCAGGGFLLSMEQLAVSQERVPQTPDNQVAAPRLYRSSTDVGWEGFVAQAFYEPRELDGWMAPARSDLALVLFDGGAMRIEQRYPHGPWKTYAIHHGELSLMPGTGMPYEVRWRGLSTAPTRTFHVLMSPDLLARTADEVAGSTPGSRALVGRSAFRDPLLSQIGFALWRELEAPSPASNLYAQSAAQLLAVHLLRHYTAAGMAIKEPVGRLTPLHLRRVVDFVQAHLGQDLSLEVLAQQSGYSAYHFSRLFRQTTGESPHQFVVRQRIERARQLLEDPDVPLAHVALASGFASQSHLTEHFKRHFGMTPRVYRREHAIRARF